MATDPRRTRRPSPGKFWKLFIVHHHFRPGGVRRVIELAAPHVARALHRSGVEVVLMGGEAPDEGWLQLFRARLDPVPVTCAIEPALGYASEQPTQASVMAPRIRRHLGQWLAGARPRQTVVWVHNQGLGRNLILARELNRACAARRIPLVLHHHDWWFDNRWQRWPEMRRAGFRSLAAVGAVILPASPVTRHAAINHADATVLRRHFGARSGWLPNPVELAARPVPAVRRAAQAWLEEQLGEAAPVWLVPCRLLRRKNLAEALLLTRWLRPAAWLVTTGGVSSADEAAYARALQRAADRHNWRLRLGVLAGDEAAKPNVAGLMAASEAILLTSLMEGFGLPNLEAAAARRPLLVRSLPNIAPDLAQFGFTFPQSYDEILVAPDLFDWSVEIRRQRRRWRTWRERLPAACRPLAVEPPLLAAGIEPHPVPFSRLTFGAQLEVLAHDAGESWARCAPLNPPLDGWRRRAARGTLAVSPWPERADQWLGGAAYGQAFTRLLRSGRSVSPATGSGKAGIAAAAEFIRAKLAAANQYPLLWNLEP